MTERLKKLVEMNEKKESDFLLFAIAKEYETDNQIEMAISFYEKLIMTYPNHIGTYYHFASILQQQDKKEAAQDIINKGLIICETLGDKHAASELHFLLEEEEDENE